MENLISYIFEEALILIPALMILGWFMKKSPIFADWAIPWLLLIAGVPGAVLLLGSLDVQNVIQGVLITGASVHFHQVYKQAKERKESP